MLEALILGLGMAMVFEGLVFALAPYRLEELLEAMAQIPKDLRRSIGLGIMALGISIIAFVLA